jgi:hypothetical protein
LKELLVWLAEREFGNLGNHLAQALLIAPTMWSPKKYDTLRTCIDFTKCWVAAMAVVFCRLDQSLLNDQTAKTVSKEDDWSGLHMLIDI